MGRLVGLLDDLRAGDNHLMQQHRIWREFPDALLALIPEYEHGKIVTIRGEVIILGLDRSLLTNRYLYIVLHNEQSAKDMQGSKSLPSAAKTLPARQGADRPVVMGVARYKAESETNYYTDPWVGWVSPTPAALAAWVANILTTTTEETPAMERRHREKAQTVSHHRSPV